MKTEFRHGWLHGRSEQFQSSSVPSQVFDVMICASSWDSRCLAITKEKSLRVGCALLVLFEKRDQVGLRNAHDPALEAHCTTAAQKLYIIRGNSSVVDGLWDEIKSKLVDISTSLGRRITLLVDISTFPRYLTGALLSLGLRQSLCSQIKLFYAEGIYKGPSSDLQGVFTGERWRFVPIIGLEGRYYPERSRFYLVSVGFEGHKTLRYVSKQEPDRVSLLFAEPGFDSEYAQRAKDNNKDLIDFYHIPPDQTAAAHAGDAISAWKELSVRRFERIEVENISYLCCGTKPHSLALMLRALVLKDPAVLYNIPDFHKVVDTEPTGHVWTYELEDVTLLKA